VKHYFYTGWPDHGVPQFATSVIGLIKKVRHTHVQNKHSPPLLIHCRYIVNKFLVIAICFALSVLSAGVGRTGTYIALDVMLQQMPFTDSVNVYECVRDMRAKRLYMVQTLVQTFGNVILHVIIYVW